MRNAGYSGAPLFKKLGIQPGKKAAFLYTPQGYDQTLGPLPQHFNLLKQALAYDWTLWISWPKKASRVETGVEENVVPEAGNNVGLADVKIAVVDKVWSGLKFMYRIKDRP